MNKSHVTTLITTAIAIIYFFIIAPLYPKSSILDITNHSNIETIKNYYAIITPFFVTLISLCGLILGFYYYNHKNGVEDFRKQKDRRSGVIEKILNSISTSYNLSLEILTIPYTSDSELELTRNKLWQELDNIETLLELASESFGMSQGELHPILSFRSYMFQNFYIQRATFLQLSSARKQTLPARQKLSELTDSAKKSCYLCIESMYLN